MYFFFELLLLGLLFFILGINMYIVSEFIYLEWNLISVGGIDFSYQIYLDYYSLMFMSVILLISGLICLYSYWYVDLYVARFYYLMLGFIISMLILVVSPNLMGMLLGWDGLGFVSFCLVLFYYNSDGSLDSSLVTLYYNRLGDGFLLVSISWMLLLSSSCSGLMWDFGVMIILLTLMGLSTKSAQFPFMSWLPKAMAAPTPVSSLVHSSTLVTAGVYMMFRFFDMVEGVSVYLNISLLTMFISGVLALLDTDLKKIIAYSTLSQLGLMVFGLCLGMSEFVYFHMLSHAIFKSMMFMSGGILIHEMSGWQDIRCYGGCLEGLPISSACLLTGSLSLSGIYFLSGFYSKDILIEMFMINSFNFIMYLMFYFCMILTLLYSLRLLDYLSFNFLVLTYVGFEDGWMSMCMMLLYIGSIMYGWMVSSLVMEFNFYDYKGVIITFYLLVLNLFVFLFTMEENTYWWDIYVYLNMDMHKLFKNFVMFTSINYLDKYWVESYGGFKIGESFYKMIFYFKDYSIYFMFMVMFFIYLLI